MRGLYALLLSISVGTSSVANTTFYGQVQTGYVNKNTTQQALQPYSQTLSTQGTFLGLKGFKPINYQTDITYMAELDARFDKAHKTSAEIFSNRQYWIGLRSKTGELRLGKQYMPNKIITRNSDPFSEQLSSANRLVQPDSTAVEALVYIQQLGKAEVALTYGKDSHLSTRPTIKGGLVHYSNGKQWGMLGVQSQARHYTDYRIALGQKTHKQQFTALYQYLAADATANINDTQSSSDTRTLLLSATHQHKQWLIKAQIGRKSDASKAPTQLLTLGIEYPLSKSLSVSLEQSVMKDKDAIIQLENDRLSSERARLIALSLRYKF